MRTSPLSLIAVGLLVTLVSFQNCSENLPEPLNEKMSSSTSPSPLPAPGTVGTMISLNSASASPSAVLPGSPIAISTKLMSNQSLTNIVLKLTITDAAQAVVWTQTFPNKSINSLQLKDLLQTFIAPENLPAGFYSVSANIFSSDLTTVLLTANSMTSFEVKPAIRVSVGNTVPYTDSLGRVWSADVGFSGSSVPTTEPLTTVQGTTDPALYSSFRWGLSPATFTFTANVPSTGKYKVTLKWVEHFVFGPNLRIFNVVINGTTVLQNFDLFGSAGGAFIAYDRTFTVTAATPQVNVIFNPGSIENPKINAIEILGAP